MNDQAFALLQDRKETVAHDQNSEQPRFWHFRERLHVAPFLKPLHADPRWAMLLVPPPRATEG